MLTLEQARDWCAAHGVTIWEDLEARRLTLSLFDSDVSASASLPDDSTETWQAVFCRLVANLRLRAELKERSRAYLLSKRLGSAPQIAMPAPASVAPRWSAPGGGGDEA